MTAGTGAATRAPRGRQLADAARSTGAGALDGLGRAAGDLVDRIGRGERHLPYTILGVVAIALLGAIVVPLSIPEPVVETPRDQVMGERFLIAWAAPGSPTAASGATAPKLDEVVKAYGADGGTACTGTLADVYETLVTRNPGGRVAFDKAAFARTKVIHSVYCPGRTQAFATFMKRRAAINARAANAAA